MGRPTPVVSQVAVDEPKLETKKFPKALRALAGLSCISGPRTRKTTTMRVPGPKHAVGVESRSVFVAVEESPVRMTGTLAFEHNEETPATPCLPMIPLDNAFQSMTALLDEIEKICAIEVSKTALEMVSADFVATIVVAQDTENAENMYARDAVVDDEYPSPSSLYSDEGPLHIAASSLPANEDNTRALTTSITIVRPTCIVSADNEDSFHAAAAPAASTDSLAPPTTLAQTALDPATTTTTIQRDDDAEVATCVDSKGTVESDTTMAEDKQDQVVSDDMSVSSDSVYTQSTGSDYGSDEDGSVQIPSSTSFSRDSPTDSLIGIPTPAQSPPTSEPSTVTLSQIASTNNAIGESVNIAHGHISHVHDAHIPQVTDIMGRLHERIAAKDAELDAKDAALAAKDAEIAHLRAQLALLPTATSGHPTNESPTTTSPR
ncbi:Abhydrolase-4 domain-containing protein [Mycena chlorophos]|uniref:Abhydrolase-4 domain-containing protein n=1 Tax=Mycena chlorophos TaxID=658473 RepID=A0A8H6W7A6_MYCCL|nr:Abhydrolase-4 domain-containing protein [Mycena chlorophos]